MADEMSLVQEYWWQFSLGVAAIAGPIIGFAAWRYPRSPKDPNPRTLTPGGEPGPRGPSNSNTTPRSIGFVDRPALMEKILTPPPQQAGVAGPRIAAICSLHGMGGIGKTELARAAARQLAPNGIAEVNLRGWDSGQRMTEEEALRELCPQIDPATDPTYTLPQLRVHWRTITARDDLAVILDNLRDENLIEPLRPTQGMTLITGRERIVRAGIQLIEVDVMEPDEATALALATHPALSPEDAAAMAKAVGYLPLAISLAAGYLARTGEAVSELERRIGQAAGGDARTLQGLFERMADLSTADLSEAQKARWLALSLPPGDFGLWTVQALWQDEDPLPELGDLVRRHLVTPAGEGRWRLHDLLRQYGKSVLAGEPEREQALWRQLGPSAVRRLGEIDDRFDKGHDDMVPALAELDAELPLLRAVQEWAAERIEADAVAAEVPDAFASSPTMDIRIVGGEKLALRQAALRAAEHRGEKAEIARAAGNLGLVHQERGEWEEALAMHRKSLAIEEELGNRAGMAADYGNFGLVYRERGEWEEALAMHRKSLAIHEELGNRAGMAAQSGNLGLVHRERGEWEEALAMHRKSLAIADDLGNRAGMARNYGNLGLVHRHRGELEEALAMHRKSLAIADDLGNRASMARQLYNLGDVLKEQGDWAGAAAHFRRSLALAEELGMPEVETTRRALAEAEAHLARKENGDGGSG